MQISESRRAAETVIDDLELADYDEDFEYYQALLKDEYFAAISYLYQELHIYVPGEHATEADEEALNALKRSVREHAQRVEGNFDEEEGEQNA